MVNMQRRGGCGCNHGGGNGGGNDFNNCGENNNDFELGKENGNIAKGINQL